MCGGSDGKEGGRAHQEIELNWPHWHQSSICLLKDLGREVF